MTLSLLRVLALGLASSLGTTTIGAQLPTHWSGVATVHNQQVPVELTLSAPLNDGSIQGAFLTGSDAANSTSGTLDGTHLTLHFDYYARTLEGELTNGSLKGTYGGTRGATSALDLHPAPSGVHKTSTPPSAFAAVRGNWELAVKSAMGEAAWPLQVTASPQGGIHAVILKVDGDTGPLYGNYDAKSKEFRVSHFTAAGPALYSIKPQPDGTLVMTNLLRNGETLVGRRPEQARKENLAPPSDPTQQTSVVDPSEPLHFSAPTLNGDTVTEKDAQFQGKVVVLAIGGSWCPNCHDEASFLVNLYSRYHTRGLEIVNLSFEEESQLKDPKRLRAFIEKYHIPYTVLLGGTTEDLAKRLPQGKNLNCWPTTFFIGRDGLVKEVHAGFSGPATGKAYTNLTAETNTLVTRLLAAPITVQR